MHNKKAALKGGMPIYKFIGNIFLTKLFNFLYKTSFTDCHTGYWQCMDTKRDRDALEELWQLDRARWKV
jgi:hypothetical protein